MQSWGTELLPRLGQYAEAARRVAAKNAAAARMTQHIEQQWPKTNRQADEMSSVGSLSSVSTATSSASINTLYDSRALAPPPRVRRVCIVTLETAHLRHPRARRVVLEARPSPFEQWTPSSKIPTLTSWMCCPHPYL